MYPISHIYNNFTFHRSNDTAVVHKTKGRRQNTRSLA